MQLGHKPEPPAHLGFLWPLLPWLSLELPLPLELVAVPKLRPQAVLPVPLSALVRGSEQTSGRRHKTEPPQQQTKCRSPG